MRFPPSARQWIAERDRIDDYLRIESTGPAEHLRRVCLLRA
ncbi:hypothetical protein [Micromonospora qiuiae]|nr:hypothetical protein [Micromonospora qiuiae]